MGVMRFRYGNVIWFVSPTHHMKSTFTHIWTLYGINMGIPYDGKLRLKNLPFSEIDLTGKNYISRTLKDICSLFSLEYALMY